LAGLLEQKSTSIRKLEGANAPQEKDSELSF
jgi:hypothetical protein